MRRGVLGVAAAAAAAGLAVAGCGGSGSSGKRAPAKGVDAAATHVLVRDRELALMPLPKLDYAADASALQLAQDESGFVDNVRAARNTIDPADTPQDVARTGHERGYSVAYRDPSLRAVQTHDGVVEVASGVELFDTDEEAHAWVAHQLASYDRLTGREVAAAVSLVRAEPFAVPSLGDEAAGTVAEYRVGSGRAWTTVLDFRVGRLLGEVVMTRGDERDQRSRVEELARKLDVRIRGVLDGSVRGNPAAGRALPGDVVAARPEGVPDLSGRTLQPGDVGPGVRISDERYEAVPGGVAGLRRKFDVGTTLVGDARVFDLTSAVDLFRTRAEAATALIALANAYASAGGRRLLAQLFGLTGATPRLAGARRLTAGDGGIAIAARFDTPLTPVTGVVVLVAAGPRMGTIVATGPSDEFGLADLEPLARKLAARLANGAREKHFAQ